MNQLLVYAVALQWVLMLVMAAMMLGMLRQIGVLHQRLPAAGALTLSGGLRPGDNVPAASYAGLDGETVSIGGHAPDGRATLLFFLSPTCPTCKAVLPSILGVAGQFRKTTRLVLASDGDEPLQRRMVSQEKLHDYPLVLSMELGRQMGVSKLPYAVLVGSDGKIIAKGLVNNSEHVESLFEAQRLGAGSIQEYLAAQRHSANGVEEFAQ